MRIKYILKTLSATLLALPLACGVEHVALRSADRIVFLGDSITEQGGQPHGYVTLLNETLTTLHPGITVIGAGISGNKVTDLQARLDRDVISKQPTLVMI